MLNSIRDLLRGIAVSKEAEKDESNSFKDESVLKNWRTESVDGRRVDVFVPQSEAPPQAAVLFLHGHGRVLLNENIVFSRLFQQYGLVAVCPDGERSW